jgi:hypothetical protein
MTVQVTREKRKHLIVVGCTAAEYEVVMGLYRASTCQTRAEYGRKQLMNKPGVVTYRFRSIDDVIEVVNGIRRLMEEMLGHEGLTSADKENLRVLFTEIDRAIIQLSDLCIQLLNSGKKFTESFTTTSEK